MPFGFVSPRLGTVRGFIWLAVNLGMVLVNVIVIAFVRVSVALCTPIRQSWIGLQRLLCATSPTQQLHLRNDDSHKRVGVNVFRSYCCGGCAAIVTGLSGCGSVVSVVVQSVS